MKKKMKTNKPGRYCVAVGKYSALELNGNERAPKAKDLERLGRVMDAVFEMMEKK